VFTGPGINKVGISCFRHRMYARVIVSAMSVVDRKGDKAASNSGGKPNKSDEKPIFPIVAPSVDTAMKDSTFKELAQGLLRAKCLWWVLLQGWPPVTDGIFDVKLTPASAD
jgi:hypothetical protein